MSISNAHSFKNDANFHHFPVLEAGTVDHPFQHDEMKFSEHVVPVLSAPFLPHVQILR